MAARRQSKANLIRSSTLCRLQLFLRGHDALARYDGRQQQRQRRHQRYLQRGEPAPDHAAAFNETRTYNTLGQLTGLTTGTQHLTYTYPTGTNDGKIASKHKPVSGETVTYQRFAELPDFVRRP